MKTQPKLYYYMSNWHHYLISKIDESWYWVFDLCTIRYTEERWKTLEEAIEKCSMYYKNLFVFNTYSELFKHMLENENNYNFFDPLQEKNLIERESFQKEKSKVFIENFEKIRK